MKIDLDDFSSGERLQKQASLHKPGKTISIRGSCQSQEGFTLVNKEIDPNVCATMFTILSSLRGAFNVYQQSFAPEVDLKNDKCKYFFSAATRMLTEINICIVDGRSPHDCESNQD